MATIYVQVKDKETQQIAVLTYKAFKDTAYRFDLIGQADEQGNLMESDPNLSPQHQRKVSEKSPAAADAGGGHQINTDGSTVPEWLVQRGLQEMRDKISEDILKKWANDAGTGDPVPLAQAEASTNAESAPLASSDGTSASDPEMFHVEQPSTGAVPDSVHEPIKERKKPGPKPKNKDL